MAEKTNVFIQDGTSSIDILPSTSADQVSITDKHGLPSNVELELQQMRSDIEIITLTAPSGSAVHLTGTETVTGDKHFRGLLTAVTKSITDKSTNVATTEYVQNVMDNMAPIIDSENLVHRSFDETITGAKTFTNSVKVPAPDTNDRSLTAATTAFVGDAISAASTAHIVNNETITGNKSYTGELRAVTQPLTDYSTLVATTEFVTDAIESHTNVGEDDYSTVISTIKNRLSSLESTVNATAVMGNKVFTGEVRAVTPLVGDISTKVATTEFVANALAAILERLSNLEAAVGV